MPILERPAYRKKSTGKWEVRFYLVDGETKKRKFRGGFKTRKHAEIWTADYSNQLKTSPLKPSTLQAFISQYLSTRLHKEQSSIDLDGYSLNPFVAFTGAGRFVSDLTAHDIEAFLAFRESSRGTHSLARDLRTLTAAFNVARSWGMIDNNPCATIPRIVPDESEVYYISVQQQKDLLAACRQLSTDGVGSLAQDCPFLWPVVAIALRTGMRKGEILRLQWSDIGPKSIQVVSRAGGRTKTGRSRSVPVEAIITESLNWWRGWPSGELAKCKAVTGSVHQMRFTRHRAELLQAAINSPWVFPSPLSPGSHLKDFAKSWKRALVLAVVDLKFHHCRHTFAVMCAFSGVPLALLSQLLGHSSLEMTQKYLRFYDSDAAAAIRLPEL